MKSGPRDYIGHGGPREGAGRRAEDDAKGTKRYNVSLDAPTVRKAKKIGEGNLSLGLRKAVRKYPTGEEK